MATIITKNSSTASSVPAAGSLQQGELAVNVTDKKLYTKDSSAAVVKLVGSLGNQEANAVAITGGTINGTAIGGTTPAAAAFTTASASGGFTGNLTGNASTVTNGVYITGSYADPAWITSLAGSKITGNISGNAANVTGTVAIANGGTGLTALGTGVQTALGQTVTGSGGIVLAASPSLTTPNLGTPSAVTLTNATGLPVSTGISGLGTNVATALGVSVGSAGSVVVNGGALGTPSSGTLTNATGLPLSTGVTGTLAVANGGTGITAFGSGVATALGVNVGSAGAFVVNGGALGTPSSGTVTNLTGTASININGTVGATTPNTGSFTTLTTSSTVTINGGTVNGVAYLNGSKVLTTGSALTFDGTNFAVGGVDAYNNKIIAKGVASYRGLALYTTTASARPTISLVNENTATKASYIQDSSAGELIFGQMNYDFGGHVEGMRLTSTGLGIGTSSPLEKLQVNGAILTTGSLSAVRTSAASLDFLSGNTRFISMGADASTKAGFIWYNSTNAAVTEAMRLDTSGNLGIGTSSPTGIFNIKTSNGQFLVQNGTSANQMRISAFNNAGNANAALIFEGYSSEYGRFDSSGNLGLGVTPSAWGSGTRAFQVGSGAALYDFGSSNVAFGSNVYFDGTNNRYINTDFATYYQQNNGAHIWANAASGTAGNTISFTQAMTLDASGQLSIGATSANSTLTVGNTDATATITSGGTNTHLNLRAMGSGGVLIFGAGGVSNGTPGTERARITSGGDLLVGKTSADYTTVGCENRANGQINASTANTDNLNIYNSTAAAYRFYVSSAGTVHATNTTISAISDQRFKENIVDLDVGLNAVMALKPRKFDWKAGKGKDIKSDRGFIAQEFEQVFPDLIDEWKDPAPEGEEPYKSVRQDLIPVLVKAIQEQQAIITDLRARVAQLEAK